MTKIKNYLKKYNTLFVRILIVLFFSNIVIIAIFLFNFLFQMQKDKANNFQKNIIEIQTLLYKNHLLINNFIIYDIKNPTFFKHKTTLNLSQQDSLNTHIIKQINNLKKSNLISVEITNCLYNLEKNIIIYQQNFDSLTHYCKIRGFKDFGLEGKMRDFAHEIESLNFFPLYKILTLRRHEKDYIIRQDKKYVQLFTQKYNFYVDEINSGSLANSQKDKLISLMFEYNKNFKLLVKSDSILGFYNNTGLIYNLSLKETELLQNIKTIEIITEKILTKKINRLKYFLIIISLFIIISSFIIAVLISKHITKPISNLSKNIKSLIDSSFSKSENFTYDTSIVEITQLIEYYFLMKKNIIDLVFNFQLTVSQRTEEIEVQKEEIIKQKLKVERINNDLLSSINYAKNIQQAIMPSFELLKKYFKNCFLIFKPKDIVSGDFIWFKNIKNEKYDIKLLAVADCTGHGIPGAFMSMMSVAYLNEIVLRKDVINAGMVLDVLRMNVISNFEHDGLDIAFLIINNSKKSIEFAGANRNLYILRNKELLKYKGNKMPIGRYPHFEMFDYQIIKYESNDTILLFTDGITDQLNELGTKYGTKHFLNTFESTEDLYEFQNIVEQNFYNWKLTENQTDDILVFAAKM